MFAHPDRKNTEPFVLLMREVWNLKVALLYCLPAIYRRFGRHPEIVGKAGLGFDAPDEIPALLSILARDCGKYRDALRVPSLQEIAKRYLEVLLQ